MAHILSDMHRKGEPIAPNRRLALCKLHHAAFHRNILGIRPDLVVEVRLDILREVDGPMLKYGLQEMQGRTIHVPRAGRLQPREEFLRSGSNCSEGRRKSGRRYVIEHYNNRK